MGYKELSKLFYTSSSSNRYQWLEEEAHRRLFAPSSFDLGIDSPHGRLFVAVPRDMSILQESIFTAEAAIASSMAEAPRLARAALIRGLILDEVVSTNAIEDIRSTRAQIAEALRSSQVREPRKKRFRELADIYLNLGSADAEMPQTPQDIRRIYDKITDGEISKEQLPDGDLFRASGVEITESGINVVHRGLEPEEKITEAMIAMLALLERKDIPSLISAIAAHYLFEYAHPFYDGNGRTGRYLLSATLSPTLALPTVLSLSRAIAENRSAYYRAFKSAESPLNKGELTFFVMSMMKLVKVAQTGVLERLEEGRTSLDIAEKTIGELAAQLELEKQQVNCAMTIAQYELFGLRGIAYLDDIARAINLSGQMTRKHLAALEEKGIVKKVSRRPLSFGLTCEARNALRIPPSL